MGLSQRQSHILCTLTTLLSQYPFALNETAFRAEVFMTSELNVALVGYAFMGRAHSNAWNQVGRFFDAPYSINKQVIIGRSQQPLQEAAERWGWANTASDLESALKDYDIDVVDIATPNDSHFPLAMTAIAAGKHVICEKPLALTEAQCAEMTEAAQTGRRPCRRLA